MTKPRLLVVDDEIDFSNHVREVAEALGFDARVINNSTELPTVYRKFMPSVIVLDMIMPDLDGIELVQWLARQGSNANIILTTGYHHSYTDAAEALAKLQGLESITTLLKPVSIKTLRETLSTFAP